MCLYVCHTLTRRASGSSGFGLDCQDRVLTMAGGAVVYEAAKAVAHAMALRLPCRNPLDRGTFSPEPRSAEVRMADKGSSFSPLVLVLGAVALLALAFFVMTGGQHGGSKKIEGDADLPQVASPRPSNSDNVGTR